MNKLSQRINLIKTLFEVIDEACSWIRDNSYILKIVGCIFLAAYLSGTVIKNFKRSLKHETPAVEKMFVQ